MVKNREHSHNTSGRQNQRKNNLIHQNQKRYTKEKFLRQKYSLINQKTRKQSKRAENRSQTREKGSKSGNTIRKENNQYVAG